MNGAGSLPLRSVWASSDIFGAIYSAVLFARYFRITPKARIIIINLLNAS